MKPSNYFLFRLTLNKPSCNYKCLLSRMGLQVGVCDYNLVFAEALQLFWSVIVPQYEPCRAVSKVDPMVPWYGPLVPNPGKTIIAPF